MSYLFIIDDPLSLKIKKDTSLHIMKEFIRQKKEIYCCGINDLSINENNKTEVFCSRVINIAKKINIEDKMLKDAKQFHTIFVRKDPPFNQSYLNASFILDHISNAGGNVINEGASLRNHNEKLGILQFPKLISPTIVSSSPDFINKFISKNKKVILKPLDGMAGNGIFLVTPQDQNINVIIETMTLESNQAIMAQKFIPEISDGDKRIILIDGEPIPYALARIPKEKEVRANLAKGGQGFIQKLTSRDNEIITSIKPYLKKYNFRFVGIDIIGNFLTEINVTSPTGLVEIENQTKIKFVESIVDALA